MESQFTKHILPRFETNGDPIKTYKLSRKTILNIVET